MIVEHVVVGPLQCNCTIVGDEQTREAIVFDGGDEADAIIERLAALDLHARYLVHSHAHFDHIGAVEPLRERTGARALLHPADLPLYARIAEIGRTFGFGDLRPVALDGDLHDDDVLAVGDVRVHVHHTPGHTPGSSSFALSIEGRDVLLTGDTLFRGAVGRWDLGGTSLEDIVESIERKLLVYDDATVVVPGHGPATTIGHERRTNPYLKRS